MPESIIGFVLQVFTTPAGWALIFLGCGAGFVIATVAFTLSVVSFPMLVDQDVSVTTAVRTSIRAVFANPITMGMWAFIVASALLFGALPSYQLALIGTHFTGIILAQGKAQRGIRAKEPGLRWHEMGSYQGKLVFFVGLSVVLPVLGHATWHLYRKVVELGISPHISNRTSMGFRNNGERF